MPTDFKYAKVALNVPLPSLFSYRVSHTAVCGARVLVQFRSRELIGIIIELSDSCDINPEKVKDAIALLDAHSVLVSDVFELGKLAANYYRHPLGEVLFNMLPSALCKPKSAEQEVVQAPVYQLDLQGDWQAAVAKSKTQQRLIAFLQSAPVEFDDEYLNSYYGFPYRQALKNLLDKKLIKTCAYKLSEGSVAALKSSALDLNQEQQQALAAIKLNHFAVYMLHGVTGSGKTEVYLQLVAQLLCRGRQVLVLVPEIGLTPQLLQRFSQRFAAKIVVLHSNLKPSQRLLAWQQAQAGMVDIVIGTRSALFVPLKRLGAIIVDECHDGSLKQQDNWRYSARDLAVWRGKLNNIPVVLGSATPSLATLYKVKNGRYQGLYLCERATQVHQPKLLLVDMRRVFVPISPQLVDKMHTHLVAGNQVILFLNRRGFAPVMLCPSCGWRASCPDCEVCMTVHRGQHKLCCHHCAKERALYQSCPDCGYRHLETQGLGTEQLEAAVRELFPQHKILRIDRDSTSAKGQLQRAFNKINNSSAQIIIGTQLLAKGHHFPKVTLVGVINADQGFYSADFQASEATGQMILQVAGRAGREQAGEVLIQTTVPDNHLLQTLVGKGYLAFADALLKERLEANLPPYSFAALFRVEAKQEASAINALRAVLAGAGKHHEVELLGPVAAPMPKRQGRYRAQLLVNANHRQALYWQIDQILSQVYRLKIQQKHRFSVDIDPLSLF